jgi:hypothetical protein
MKCCNVAPCLLTLQHLVVKYDQQILLLPLTQTSCTSFPWVKDAQPLGTMTKWLFKEMSKNHLT